MGLTTQVYCCSYTIGVGHQPTFSQLLLPFSFTFPNKYMVSIFVQVGVQFSFLHAVDGENEGNRKHDP